MSRPCAKVVVSTQEGGDDYKMSENTKSTILVALDNLYDHVSTLIELGLDEFDTTGLVCIEEAHNFISDNF